MFCNYKQQKTNSINIYMCAYPIQNYVFTDIKTTEKNAENYILEFTTVFSIKEEFISDFSKYIGYFFKDLYDIKALYCKEKYDLKNKTLKIAFVFQNYKTLLNSVRIRKFVSYTNVIEELLQEYLTKHNLSTHLFYIEIIQPQLFLKNDRYQTLSLIIMIIFSFIFLKVDTFYMIAFFIMVILICHIIPRPGGIRKGRGKKFIQF